MLLTITTIHRAATDLGCLLPQNPAVAHEKDLSWGEAQRFFPEVREERCTVALLEDARLARIVGRDASPRSLAIDSRGLRQDEMQSGRRERSEHTPGPLTCPDALLEGFDTACVCEVTESQPLVRLEALERVVLERARPRCVGVRTSDQECNAVVDALPAGAFRHADHRSPRSRAESGTPAESCAGPHGCGLGLLGIGPEDAMRGSGTQTGVFRR